MHVKHLIELRANKIHTSSLVLMSLVQTLQERRKSAYIGEISAMYSKYDPNNYQYESIYSMLTRLVERELMYVEKHGQFNSYSLTTKGFDLVHKF